MNDFVSYTLVLTSVFFFFFFHLFIQLTKILNYPQCYP